MIVVKVELHSAVTGRVTEIGRLLIANKGNSRDPSRGDYSVRLGRRGQRISAAVWNSPQRVGEVLGYPRLSYSVWKLVVRALKAVGL